MERLTQLLAELRQAGVPISLGESIDAGRALFAVPLGPRAVWREALSTTLVKSTAHRAVFDACFDRAFSLEPSVHPGMGWSDLQAGARVDEELSADALLRQALRRGDATSLQMVASLAVARSASSDGWSPLGVASARRSVLSRLGLEAAIAELAAERAAARTTPADAEFAARVAALALRRAERELKAALSIELRRALGSDRDRGLLQSGRVALPEDVDFLYATRAELAAIEEVLQPLARSLAATLSRRARTTRKGTLDFRRTLARARSTGGVPFDPVVHTRRPRRPQIWLLADVSGSVASFARFTLALVQAMSSSFSAVRSFAFIDEVDEVTSSLTAQIPTAAQVRRILSSAAVVAIDGHSDYGRVFRRFAERFGTDIGPRSTVIVLGDARNNGHVAGLDALEIVAHRAGALYWLNPEPRAYWDSGDSAMSAYAASCTAVVECRNLRQLERFVTGLRAAGHGASR
jgi:uncharacterized protein with von Willebrand factor type A (vWA) domain